MWLGLVSKVLAFMINWQILNQLMTAVDIEYCLTQFLIIGIERHYQCNAKMALLEGKCDFPN